MQQEAAIRKGVTVKESHSFATPLSVLKASLQVKLGCWPWFGEAFCFSESGAEAPFFLPLYTGPEGPDSSGFARSRRILDEVSMTEPQVSPLR